MKDTPRSPEIGDKPIDFKAYDFSAREAAALSLVPERTIRNWEYRRISGVQIGRRTFVGRLQFRLVDIVTLHVMHYLSSCMGFSPENAAPIALAASELMCFAVEDPATGQQSYNRVILVCCGDDGEIVTGLADSKGAFVQPPNYGQDPGSLLHKPYTIVPVDSIRRAVVERLCALVAEPTDTAKQAV